MEIADLQKMAQRNRTMRQSGIALILASCVLAAFLFIPLSGEKTSPVAAGDTTATSTPNAFSNVQIEARAAIVYDLTTGKPLFEKNADAQLPLASLTKLLTVYAALSELSPSTPITISSQAALADAPHAFNPGQVFTLSDLARLTLTASLNDGAAAIAEATADQENVSTESMLASAAGALGLSQTYAVNGNGLDVNTQISGGYGSAHDIAVLAGALLQKAPDIAEATIADSAQAVSEGGTAFTVHNTDPSVGNIPHLLLSKTGLTDLAGGNLALVFDVGLNHPVAVVVLGSSKDARFTDGQALVAATLAYFANVPSL